MNKQLSNNLGMTLIELLGAIVILVIISGLTFPILLNGLKTATTIQQEVKLRDEADYLMAAVLKEIYVMKESEINKVNLPAKGTANYFLIKMDPTKSNGKKTGFINDELILSDTVINAKDSSIILSPNPTITFVEPNQYEISFELQLKGDKPKKMKFVNVIRTINDIDIKEQSS